MSRNQAAQQRHVKQSSGQPGLRQPMVYTPNGKLPLDRARLLAVDFQNSCRYQEAEAVYRAILSLLPNDWWSLHYLGVISYKTDRLDLSLTFLKSAQRLNPSFAVLYNDLGNTLTALNLVDEAVAVFQQGLALDPKSFHILNNWALVCKRVGRNEEAETLLRRAIQQEPAFIAALANLEDLCWSKGDAGEAFQLTRRLIALAPDNAQYWHQWTIRFRKAVLSMALKNVDQALWQEIDHSLSLPIYVRNLLRPAYLTLERYPPFATILAQIGADDWRNHLDYLSTATTLANLPILTKLMSAGHVLNPAEEKMFTRLRMAMLEAAMKRLAAGETDTTDPDLFSIALAELCFNNDYSFAESHGEKNSVALLQKAIENTLAKQEHLPCRQIVVLAAYLPLYRLPWVPRLTNQSWSAGLQPLIQKQVINPLFEQTLYHQIGNLRPIQNEVSRQVRDMYEETPYPRWGKTLLDRPQTLAQLLAKTDIAPENLVLPQPEQLLVLVAGCGTGQQSVMAASCYQNGEITAIDLSLPSLAYALRQTQNAGLNTIRYWQGDILDVELLDKIFHVIECVGVLHHMEDPFLGWQTLLKVLLPGGVMRVGLYSELARQSVVEMRERIASRNLDSSPETIRQFRQEILAGAANSDQTCTNIVGTQDFFNLNECRDLLFHVQEHRFTLPIIASFLEKSGLKFLGFHNLDRSVVTTFQAMFPNAMTDLSCWDAFEKNYPATFFGMYDFWILKV